MGARDFVKKRHRAAADIHLPLGGEPVGFLKEPGDIWVPYAWERARSGSRGNQNLR